MKPPFFPVDILEDNQVSTGNKYKKKKKMDFLFYYPGNISCTYFPIFFLVPLSFFLFLEATINLCRPNVR